MEFGISNRSASFGALLSTTLLLGCGQPAEIQGLPTAEFNRVFLAAIEVGSAEHCGDKVNGQLIRSNLLKYQTGKGLPQETINQSEKVYDNTVSQYKSRLASETNFCTTQYKPSPNTLRQYEKGEFPEVT